MASLAALRAPSGSYVPMGFRSTGTSRPRGLRSFDIRRYLPGEGGGSDVMLPDDIAYLGGSRYFDEGTGTYRGGRGRGRYPRYGGGERFVNGKGPLIERMPTNNPMLQQILEQLKQIQQPTATPYTGDFDRLAQSFQAGPVNAETYGRTATSRDQILAGYSPAQIAEINKRYYGGALDTSSAQAFIENLRRNDQQEHANRGWSTVSLPPPSPPPAPALPPPVINDAAKPAVMPVPKMATPEPGKPELGMGVTLGTPLPAGVSAPTTTDIHMGNTLGLVAKPPAAAAPAPAPEAPKPAPAPAPVQTKKIEPEDTFGGGPDHAKGGPIRWPRPMAVGGSVRAPSMRGMSRTGRVSFPSISDFLGRTPRVSTRRGRRPIVPSDPVDPTNPIPTPPPPPTPPPGNAAVDMLDGRGGGSDGGDVADARGQGRDQASYDSLEAMLNDPQFQKDWAEIGKFAGPTAMFATAIKEVLGIGGGSAARDNSHPGLGPSGLGHAGGVANPELMGRDRSGPAEPSEGDGDAPEGPEDTGGNGKAKGGRISRQEGGLIEGEGGPTEDQVEINASPGEFMMDVATTRFWSEDLLKLMQDVAHGQGDPAELARLFEAEMAKATKGRPAPGPVGEEEEIEIEDAEDAPTRTRGASLSRINITRFLPKSRIPSATMR